MAPPLEPLPHKNTKQEYKVLLETIIENYHRARLNKEQLIELQNWLRSIK